MPDPAKFKGEGAKKRFMEKCMHQTLHKEKKDPDQAKAQCLNMFRSEKGGDKAPKKKMATKVASEFINQQA